MPPAALPNDPAQPLAAGQGWLLLRTLDAGPFRLSHKQYAPTFRQGLHAHAQGTLDFNLAGGGSGTYAGTPVDSVAGLVELYAPGREHSFRAGPRGIRTMHVAFGPEVFAHRRADDLPAGRGVDQASAVGLAARLLRELTDPDASSPLAAEALAFQLLDAASRWSDRPERGARWLAWVRDRLHAGGEPSLHQLAALAGVHRAHLARSFSDQYGLSVGEYHRRLRLASAASRLAQGTVPLARLARDSGFSDQAHLTRWFSRVLGITPGRYAAALRRERTRLPLPAR